MIMSILGLFLRMVVVLAGTALGTFALLWNAHGDPAQAIAMARFDALLTQDVIDQVRDEVGLTVGFWKTFLLGLSHCYHLILATLLSPVVKFGRTLLPRYRILFHWP
ncbi:MAG: hypothetical protein OXC62_05110 [Aestuariivita sp.]|nr:hypothetical protein [Aestuariivita sp.]